MQHVYASVHSNVIHILEFFVFQEFHLLCYACMYYISSSADSVHVSLMELDKADNVSSSRTPLDDKKWPTGFLTQYKQLTLRTFKTSKSQMFSKFKLIETVVLTAIVSLIWFQLPRTEETLRDRMGVVSTGVLGHQNFYRVILPVYRCYGNFCVDLISLFCNPFQIAKYWISRNYILYYFL